MVSYDFVAVSRPGSSHCPSNTPSVPAPLLVPTSTFPVSARGFVIDSVPASCHPTRPLPSRPPWAFFLVPVVSGPVLVYPWPPHRLVPRLGHQTLWFTPFKPSL